MIKTKLWTDTKVLKMSSNARLLFIYLLTSPYVGMTSYFECPDAFISISIGIKDLTLTKQELSSSGLCHFFDGWVFIPKLEDHNRYKNSPKNLPTYEQELEGIPNRVLEHFNSTLDTSIDSGMDSGIYTDLKSKTINHKSKTINQKQEIVEISQEKKQEIADRYKVPLSFVESKYDDLQNYCKANGRKYKDYEAALMNWVKRDALQVLEKHHDKQKYTSKYKVTKL